MYYAIAIRMKTTCQNSNNLTEIKDVYIENCGWFSKEYLYDYLKDNPESIKVKRTPYPFLIPALSSSGEKYVRSNANDYVVDNLLYLPRK